MLAIIIEEIKRGSRKKVVGEENKDCSITDVCVCKFWVDLESRIATLMFSNCDCSMFFLNKD